jgi:hypothetical protein
VVSNHCSQQNLPLVSFTQSLHDYIRKHWPTYILSLGGNLDLGIGSNVWHVVLQFMSRNSDPYHLISSTMYSTICLCANYNTPLYECEGIRLTVDAERYASHPTEMLLHHCAQSFSLLQPHRALMHKTHVNSSMFWTLRKGHLNHIFPSR